MLLILYLIMKIRRRDILSGIAGLSITGSMLKADWHDKQERVFLKGVKSEFKTSLIIPKAIQKGDKIAITAPASPTTLWELNSSIKFIKSLGCKPIIGATAQNWETRDRYFSASEKLRSEEFMKFIQDPDITAIICARGGYGVMRILDLLDFDLIKQNPKIIMGYSDITALLIAINRVTGLTTYHGPLANSTFGSVTANSFIKVLVDQNTTSVVKRLNKNEYAWTLAETLIPGTAKGKLTGGNLSMICSTLGTPYEIITDDSILFIEEVFEEPYKIDRMLTQLSLAGKLQKCKGFIFGKFQNLNERKPFFPGLQFSVRQIIDQLILPLNKPTLINFPIGHGGEIITLPIGVSAVLSANEKKLTFLESTVTKL